MNKEAFLREFMDQVWNSQGYDKVEKYVHKEYKVHLDTADEWEGKTLSHAEFRKRLKFSFDSFPKVLLTISKHILAGIRVFGSICSRVSKTESTFRYPCPKSIGELIETVDVPV